MITRCPPRAPPGETHMQALVVDDSRAMRIIIGRVLKELGFEVLEAGHGGEAIERLKTAPGVSLAMVDWNMPVMNGNEYVMKPFTADILKDKLAMLGLAPEGGLS